MRQAPCQRQRQQGHREQRHRNFKRCPCAKALRPRVDRKDLHAQVAPIKRRTINAAEQHQRGCAGRNRHLVVGR